MTHLSIEACKRLKEAGLKQWQSTCYYFIEKNGEIKFTSDIKYRNALQICGYEMIDCPSTDELIEQMTPEEIEIYCPRFGMNSKRWFTHFINIGYHKECENLTDYWASVFIHLRKGNV